MTDISIQNEEKGYIINIDDKIEELYKNGSSYADIINELKLIYESNGKLYSFYSEQNKKIETILNSNVEIEKEYVNDNITPVLKVVRNKSPKTFEKDKDFFLGILEHMKSTDEIGEVLSFVSDSEREDLLTYILIELNRKLIYLERELASIEFKEMRELFSSDLKTIKKLVQIIIDYRKIKKTFNNMDENKEKEENTVIFVERENGNIGLVSDINDIPVEYYEDIYDAIKAIDNKTYNYIKKFQVCDLYEVRSGSIRVLFNKIGKYDVVLGVALKKQNRLSSDLILTYYNEFMEYKDSLIEEINSSEFIEENEIILNEIYNSLSMEEKLETRKYGEIIRKNKQKNI